MWQISEKKTTSVLGSVYIRGRYDKIDPEYGFASNKGYGTAKHIEALKAYGACDIHRRSFIGNFVGE